MPRFSAAFWADLAAEGQDEQSRQHYQALTDFMTPIVKAYCSDAGFRVCETAMQCLGGYGYCRGYPIEHYMRDAKIMSLYEGTNGIQAIDLMGRKMRINDGAMFAAFAKEMENFIDARRDHDHLGGHVRDLENAFARAQKKGRKNEFFRGKVAQATFFADTVLPHTIERAGTCTRQGREIVEIADTAF